jgi:hypothetical protein
MPLALPTVLSGGCLIELSGVALPAAVHRAARLAIGVPMAATLAPQARLWAGAAADLPPELVLGWRGDGSPSDLGPARRC